MRVNNTLTNSNNIIEGPATAVDVLIFTTIKNKLGVLLIKIGQGPYQGKWALPGGLVKLNENLDDAAKRILTEKAGLKGVYLEQLYTFGDVNRDARGRSISVAYFALVNSDKFNLQAAEYYTAIEWQDARKLPPMAFDHKKIIESGIGRLKSKLEYTNVAYGLLPKEFSLTELQQIYEIILGKKLDKRNFRKKVKTLNILKAVNKTTKGLKNRPAELYQFTKMELIFTK